MKVIIKKSKINGKKYTAIFYDNNNKKKKLHISARMV